jgi:pullulanase
MSPRHDFRSDSFHVLVATLLGVAAWVPQVARAAPSSVTVAGSLQSELGCSGDWQPDCAITHLIYDAGDDVWQGSWSLPADSYEYKAALDDGWAENYGAYAQPNGANIPLLLPAGGTVKFYYDDKTHWITDNKTSIIATVPGSFQSELGCGSDWDPACLRTWLQDIDGDGTYTFITTAIPPGSYEAKVAINESWDENYGQGGIQNGSNIPFYVPAGSTCVIFLYDSSSHALSIFVKSPPPSGVSSVTIAGSLQSELGCSGDWEPDCALTHMNYSPEDDVWQNGWLLPPGDYEYKAALNDSWVENYGDHAQLNGGNIGLASSGEIVKFYYDHKTHWITDSKTSIIATVPGSFQSELGCGGDWDPACLRSWLQDVDGDGTYTFTTNAIPAGSYEAKVAINESWDENYGDGGTPGGANIPFAVPSGSPDVTFSYDSVTHVLTITVEGVTPAQKVSWGKLKTLYR